MKQIDYLRKSRKNCSALLMACALTFMLLTTTLSFAQTNSLTLGCPTASGNSYQYQDLSFTTSTDFVVTSISVSFSDDPASCSIALPTLPTGWSVDPSSNEYSKYIILPEGTDDVTIRDFLSGITYTVPDNSIKNVQIILLPVAAGKIIRYSENGHYYQFVPFTEAEADWTWIECYNAAKEMTYCGRQGYLATLTSLGEDKFVTRLVSSSMWIGGTRLSPTDDATSTGTQYYASFDVEDNNRATDALSGDYWYWACGPEKGTRITNEVTNSNNNTNWYANQPSYSNWCWKDEWPAEFEPNNALHNDGEWWDPSYTYESCLTILNIGRSSVHNHTTGIGWNDIGYDRNIKGDFSDQEIWLPQGFMVEYGNQIIGDTNPETDECSISASGKVGNANDTSRVTLSGNDTICVGESATLTLLFEGAYPFTGKVTGGGQEYEFTTNDVFYTFTVTPTETTTYTVSEFSDASSTTGSDGCPGVYNIIYETSGSATVTVNNPQVALTDIAPVAICAGASTNLTATTETATGEVSYAWSTGATGSEITVTPSETTTYTVTATATQGGCTATATKEVTVTVNTPQVALNDIASVAICAGASTTLTAELDGTPTGDVSYAWSIGATENEITVTPSETTTYTVTATATQGECTATATKEVTVTVNALPTATVSVTDVKCKGAGDGIITVNANGGSGSYQYQLGTGVFQDSSVFTGLNAGSYTLTVKDGNSCTTTTTATIDEPAQLTLTIVSATDETCKENNDGTIAYTVGGGTPNYTVTFAEGISAIQSEAGTYTQSNLLAGDYVVKVVDQNGCSVTAPAVTIKEPATLEIRQVGDIEPAQCKGDNNGQFAFSIAGGNGTNTITINGGAVTLATPSEGVYTQTGLAADTYTVSVTDNKGCSATKDFVVGEPDEVLSATVTSTQESCAGNDGTATVTAVGGNGGYTYLWSDGQTTAQAAELTTMEANNGFYSVTATDSKGCTATNSVTITLNNPLDMEDITGPVVCTGTEFSITPEDGTNGTIPAGTIYSWPTPDAIPGIGGLEAGTNENRIHGVLTNTNNTPQTVSYVVTPKNGVCVGNAVGVTVTVTTTVNPNVTIDMPNAMTVCSNADDFNLSATFVNSVSNSTVVWKKDGTPMATHTVTGDTDSYAIDLANDTCKGQYTYRVEYTDESGCTASDECVITVNAGDWSITQSAGTDTIECVSDTTEPAASLLPIVYDGCGRVTDRTLLRRESNPTEITCTGTVTYTYRYTACDDTYKDWTYTYTINDVTDPTIAANAITTKAANIDQTACKFSIPDLTADIRAKASDNCTEAAYLVITQEPAAGIVITAATDVDVTVTDKCGNSTTHTVNVTVPTLPTATIAPTHILCHGNTTGSATVTPTSGTAPYTYLWSNSQTVATATKLDNTEYTVTVTDVNGCSTTASVTITEPEALAATTDTIPVDCHGNSTGSATITVTGGIPSYSVIVNEVTKSGNSALTFENLPDGTYPVTIKDANNCELTGVSVTITEPEVLAISAELTQVKCKDGSNGAIDLTVTGGNGSYQYVWNNDSTTQDLTNLTAGEYNVTVKDAKNCSVSGTYTITEPALLQISSITPTNITCPSGNDGKIEVAVTGGTTPYSYQLNGGDAQSSAIFETLTAGNYTVTVTDANGCSTTSSTTLTQPTPLTLTGCPTNITENTDADKSYATVTWTEPAFSPMGNGATLNVTGKTATNQYSVGTTTITYTVINTCGESQSCSFTITVSDNQAPEITCAVTGNQDVVPNSAGNTYTHSGNSWNATATDNVAVVSLTYTLTGATDDNTPKTTLDGQVFNYGTTTVTWKATDNTGASDVCSFQVVVADNTKPELACPTIDTVYECLAEVPATYANYAAFTAAGGRATDNHQINESSLTVTDTVVTGCSTTITRTYSIKDMTGNEGTCTQVITVEDKTAPALTGTWPANITGQNNCFANRNISGLLSNDAVKDLYTDNCGGELTVDSSDVVTGDDCGWTVTRTYTIKDSCGNTVMPKPTMIVSGRDQTAPSLTGTWPENITGQNSCLSNADTTGLKDDSEIKALYSDCSEITVTHTDAIEGDACGWTVTRTYTITDSCNNSVTQTMSVSGRDSIAPSLTGTWPSNITGQDNCFANAVTSGLYTDDQVKALYSDCSTITVTHTDANTLTSDCGWTITRTYTIKDACNNTVTPAPTMSVSGSDQTAPALTGTWPTNITGQDNCFANADISELLSNDDVKALYSDCSTITVTHEDANTLTSDCGWTITRTYTIKDACNNTVTPAPTMSVSGSDQTAPALTGTWPTNITDQDNCFANAVTSGLYTDDQVKALYSDCSTITVTHTDANTLTSDCGWTITRTYTIKDACNNTVTPAPTMSVSGSDQTAPALTGTWPEDITGQDNCFANAVTSGLYTDDQVKALYSDCSTITVTHEDANTLTDNCGWTITRTYTIKDACGNTVIPKPTMSVSGSDQTDPELTGTWPENITGQDNCFAAADISDLLSDDDVKALYSDCSTITVTHTDANILTDDCGWTITRTYTIKDACDNSVTRTMSVSGSDQSAPALTGTWPENITGQNSCLANANISGLYTDEQVKALYSDCSTITVTHTDANTLTDDCGWTITRAYTIKDACGNTVTPAPAMSVSGSDQTAPVLAGTWPSDSTGQNSCLSNADTTGLKDDSEIKALYNDCSEITVTHTDTIEGNACDWTVTRTYTIKDSCGNTVTPAPTMSVSGSDQTAPAIGTDDLNRTLTATNCVFTIPDMREIVRNISTDCSEITVTQPSAGMVVYPMVEERDTTVNVIVTDSCGNSSVKEVVITIPAKVTISATATPAVICYGATSQLTATPSNVVGTATYNWTPSDGLNNATIANPVATLTTTTTYTVEVTDENGCAATATTTVTVNPEVVMDTVAPMTLCVGDVTSYSFTTPLTVGTMSYAWTNSNPAIGLVASGEGDILSFTPTNTTNAPINATITVTPSHTYNDIICQGDPINFTITVRPSITTPGNVEFACPADTTVVLSYSDCEQLVNIGEPEFVNHMSGMTVNITNDAPEGNIFPEGTTVVTWTATDDCGDTLTCTQNVVIQFPPCGDTIADFDGYRYSSVRIGCQCWTGENARSEHYSDGTPVDNFRYYNDSDSLENIYGKLYTWYTAVRVPEGDNNAEPSISTDPFGTTYVQGICPEGWALPTVNEYMQMIANSGDATHAKDGSNLYWLPGYEGQPPFSGFDAYGAGKYNGAIDRYQELLGKTHFWTTLSGSGSETATTVEINYYCAEGLQTELSKGDGVSIRCIRKR